MSGARKKMYNYREENNNKINEKSAEQSSFRPSSELKGGYNIGYHNENVINILNEDKTCICINNTLIYICTLQRDHIKTEQPSLLFTKIINQVTET